MEKANVFVIMPFTDDFFESYEMFKNKFDNEFNFIHAGDVDNQQNILADIIRPIYEADIIIADLTTLNPNVMYELGIAHSLNKKTIIITRDELNTLPFDLAQYRATNYSTHFKKFIELLEYLEKNLRGAISETVVFSNPVNDFLKNSKINLQQLFKEDKLQVNIENTENGFLDFLAEIEEDTAKMTENIEQMSSELEEMGNNINRSTSEIERVNKTGGSGSASFMRKEARKVSGYINEFSKKLKIHNENYTTLWNKIEKNNLGLIENEYAVKDENKDSLIDYFRELYKMQKAIIESNTGVLKLKESSWRNLGIERSMSQSIRFLDEDLQSYLAITNQMDASINRILNKGKYVIGKIEFE